MAYEEEPIDSELIEAIEYRDHWIESTHRLSKCRVSFSLREVYRAEEDEYGGTKVYFAKGDEANLEMPYDHFREARMILTDSLTFGAPEEEN